MPPVSAAGDHLELTLELKYQYFIISTHILQLCLSINLKINIKFGHLVILITSSFRSTRPVTWRHVQRWRGTRRGPPGCPSTWLRVELVRSRGCATCVALTCPTPTSCRSDAGRWRRASAPTMGQQPARRTVSSTAGTGMPGVRIKSHRRKITTFYISSEPSDRMMFLPHTFR